MLHKSKIPLAFSMVKKGDTTILVKDRYKEIILPMVFDTGSLHDRNKDNPNVKFGRGTYLSIPSTKNGTERFIIRNYRHGGLLGRLFGGVFYNENRPLNEIHINEVAIERGVPSAEAIAVTRRKLWGLFYKADFISKEISGAVDTTQFLKESPLNFIQKSKKSIIYSLVRLIRNMHDAGIFHADLHLKNILLKRNSNGEFDAYIIDLDKSVILNKLNIDLRIKNLLRLDRSIEKLRWLSGVATTSQKKIGLISRADRIRFFKSYMLYGNPLDKNWKMYVRQYRSQHAMHKLWWRVLGLS
ncbi:MAG: hypothetical protein NG747_07330 [Candidatus Brocadia sp.]|nr:hypothetical protein [Candidatus Brocadia sp.]